MQPKKVVRLEELPSIIPFREKVKKEVIKRVIKPVIKEKKKIEKEDKKERIIKGKTLKIKKKPKNIKITLKILIIVVLLGIIIFIGISVYFYFKSPIRQIGIGANIESALLSPDNQDVYVKLLGGSDKNITKIKFIFTDFLGEEHYYETTEGAVEISVAFERSFWDWLFGKPKFKGKYEYRINAEDVGLFNFEDIEEVSVLFEYEEEGITVETGVLDTTKTTTKTTRTGGGNGNGDNGGTTTGCTDTCESLGYECGTQSVCGENRECGGCDVNETCIAGTCFNVSYPGAEIQYVIIDEDVNTLITLISANLSGALIYEILVQPSHGSLININFPNVTFDPAWNYYGNDLFIFSVGNSSELKFVIVNVTINSVNDPPALYPGIIYFYADETMREKSYTIMAYDWDSELTYVSNNLPAEASLDSNTGELTWTINSSYIGTYSNIRINASDGEYTDSEIFEIIVKGSDVYYVDGDLISDCNGDYSIINRDCSGTDGNAYNTIQEAADVAQVGDFVYVRQGNYYEEIVLPDSGNSGNFITFSSYNNEDALIDGSDYLTGFTQCDDSLCPRINPSIVDNVYVASVSEDISSFSANLYENNQMMQVAQDPDPLIPLDYEMPTTWMEIPDEDYSSTQIVDPAYFNQPDANYWDNAYVMIWSGNNNIYTRKINAYNPLTGTITFDYTTSYILDRDKYSIWNHPSVLNHSGEYYVDEQSNRVYVWPYSTTDLDKISVSVRETGFFINNQDYIKIDGFRFRRQSNEPTEYHSGNAIRNAATHYTDSIYFINNDVSEMGLWSGTAVWMGGCSNCVADNNYVHDTPGRGISFSGTSSRYAYNVTASNNRLERVWGTGIVFFYIDGGRMLNNTNIDSNGQHANGLTVYLYSRNILVENNTIINYNNAFTMNSVTNITVRNNVFAIGPTVGSSAVMTVWDREIENALFDHNTIINSSGHAAVQVIGPGTKNITLSNNIVDGILLDDRVDPSEYTLINNLYMGLTWNMDLTEMGVGGVLESDVNNIFIDYALRDYRPLEGGIACSMGDGGYVGALPCVCTNDSQCEQVFGENYSCNAEGKCVASAPVQKTNNITQFGITWFFDKPLTTDPDIPDTYQYGTFVNGDYWVVPENPGENVTIVDIDPLSVSGSREKNGAMVNPDPSYPLSTGNQGYDSAMLDCCEPPKTVYNSDLNKALNVSASNPLKLSGGNSLVSTISWDTPKGVGPVQILRTAAILTVLNSAPPEGSFRPAYSGPAGKTVLFNKNTAINNMHLLKSLDTTGIPVPTLKQTDPNEQLLDYSNRGNSVERMFERPWLMHIPGWSNYAHPTENLFEDGKDIADAISMAALMLHLNFTNPEKETLLIRYMQLGIDLYGIANNTIMRHWNNNGQINQGRKWPILFAGIMLDDSVSGNSDDNMRAIGEKTGDYLYNGSYGAGNPPPDYFHFQEDDQTFYIDDEAVNRVYTPTCGGYTTQHLGWPEWGIQHSTSPFGDALDWSSYLPACANGPAYRHNNAAVWPGFILAALMMEETASAKTLWNHDSLFDYEDRFVAIWKYISGQGLLDGITIDFPGVSTAPDSWKNYGGFYGSVWDRYRADYGCIYIEPDPPGTENRRYSCLGEIFDCGLVNQCSDYTNQRACSYDPCNINCSWDGSQCVSGDGEGAGSMSPFTRLWNFLKSILTGKTGKAILTGKITGNAVGDGENGNKKTLAMVAVILIVVILIIVVMIVKIKKNKKIKLKTKKKFGKKIKRR